MILYPLHKNEVELCTATSSNTITIIQKPTPLIRHECHLISNNDFSNDDLLLLYRSDTYSSTSSSNQSNDQTSRRNALNTVQNQPIVGNDIISIKKRVRFHETTRTYDGKQKNKKRELLSLLFEEKKSLSSKTMWYTVKEIKSFKKYQKAYATYIKSIDPNDLDMMINTFDEKALCTENHKLICLRGMEKFIERTSSSDCNNNVVVVSSGSTRRKVLYEAVLSIQLLQQQKQKHTNSNNDLLLINDDNDELIRSACLPITMSSIQYAYDIAQKDSYIAIHHQVNL